jgi:hypothetical protein
MMMPKTLITSLIRERKHMLPPLTSDMCSTLILEFQLVTLKLQSSLSLQTPAIRCRVARAKSQRTISWPFTIMDNHFRTINFIKHQ